MQSGKNLQSESTPSSPEPAKLVSADAVFTSHIDSQKMPPGSQFHAKLLNKIRLDNGTELATGTILVGQIVDDGAQPAGTAKLALRFTEANLKNGQTVPIKATIVNVYDAESQSAASNYNAFSSPPPPANWNGTAASVDEIDAVPGVDLHSNRASSNSGVFVSTKKDDIRLSPNVGLQLVIAARGSDQQGDNKTSTSGTQLAATR